MKPSPPELLSLAIRLWEPDALIEAAERCSLVVDQTVPLGEVQGWVLRRA